MASTDLQDQCALGQEQLMRLEYLQAERTLAAAEKIAWESRDFDALSRLYLPLQEARRQRRQRCAEGPFQICFGKITPEQILKNFDHGELIVASSKTITPAVETRQLVSERNLYVDVFLATVLVIPGDMIVGIVPFADHFSPAQHGFTFRNSELSLTSRYAMELWERLHRPFLVAAEAEIDPLKKIELFRTTTAVDYGCELAHQHLAEVARQLCKSEKKP